ncbi:MAG: hypothetical protein IT251_09920 [Chitinophagaceae bacterium]|nr:hypothetical protein [Chitinophagaceae bacterium]
MNLVKYITNYFSSKNRIFLVCILTIHVIISYYFISKQYITYDEPSYIEYSKRWLHGKPERVEALDDSKTPVISIVWLPRIVQQIIQPNLKQTDFGKKDQEQGRYMMIIFSLLLLIYFYKFLQLLKIKYWLPVFLFIIIDPLLIAYSVLINSDLLSGLVLLAIIYHLYQYLFFNKRNHLIYSCIWLATGLVTKLSFVFFIPVFWLIIFVVHKKIDWRKFLLFVLLILLVVNTWFYFKNTCLPLGQFQFSSNTFKLVQQFLHFLHWLPLPLPENYIYSIDLLQYHAQLGGSYNNTYPGVYILNKFSLTNNFWYYYLVAAWYKFPISILFLITTGLFAFLYRFKKNIQKYWIIIISIVYYLLVLSCFNKFQIGIRHLLIVLPLMYILIAVLLNYLVQTKFKWGIAILWLFMFLSVAKYYPNLIPYTNELVTNKAKVYEKLMDTSIDYGQSKLDASNFLQQNTDFKTLTETPQTGKYLVSMQQLVLHQMYKDTSYNWLIKNYEPIGMYKYVYLQFKIDELKR